MKIGLVLPNIPAYSETFFRNKIFGLQQNGHEVILFVNNSKSESNYLNCTIKKAPNFGGNKLSILINSFIQILKAVFLHPKKSFKLYQLNKKDKISLVQSLKQIISNQFLLSENLDWLHFGFGTMALGRENVAQVIGAKMAVSFRGFDIGIYPIKHPNCYKLLYEKVDKVHVISDDLIQLLYKNGLQSNTLIQKITPAIDTSFFELKSKTKNEVLKFTTIARLHWKKGLEYTIEALALLKKENIPFHFSIIGEGVEKERLAFACHQLGVSENISFLGKLSPEKVKEELSNTHIYLQYSIQEGFCNAVLEAQAMELLCVVSNAEGLSENILHNQTGWVVPKRNPKLLAQKIKEIIELSDSEKGKITQNAVKRVQKEFNLQKQQQEFLAFYA